MAGSYLLPIVAISIVFLSFFKVIKSVSFTKAIALYSIVNFPVVFFLVDGHRLYITGFITTVLLLASIKIFINKTYNTDSYLGLEGIVTKSPRLSIILRTALLMVGNFPPFVNFGVVYNNLINIGLSISSIYILLAIAFNSILFSKLTRRMLFGRPNQNLVYTDLKLKDFIFMGLLAILNLVCGIYYLLNL